jgi:hypothetical protein
MQGPSLLERLPEQFIVTLPRLFLLQADLPEVDLVLQLQMALRRTHPDGAGRGGQPLDDPLEELAEVIGGLKVHFREAADLVEQDVDLPPGFLNLMLANDLRIRLNSHGYASW